MKMEKIQLAIKYLDKAISLHQAHMSGEEPTTGAEGEKSQQELMDLILFARKALNSSGGME